MTIPATTIPAMMTPATTTKRPANKYRNELKIQLSPADEIILRSRLSRVFETDKHADSHGNYRVSSLYFDTPEDQALREKLSGLQIRDKYRLRYYDDRLDFIRLEKKSKHGSVSTKRQARLSLEQVERIVAMDIDWLLGSDVPLLVELYIKMRHHGLRPRSITRYDRTAYRLEAGNVRLTIDRNLHISWDPADFLQPDKPLFPTADAAILEIKYDDFLPDIVRQVSGLSSRRSGAYSKYAASRRFD